MEKGKGAVGLLDIPPTSVGVSLVVTRVVVHCIVSPLVLLNNVLPVVPCAVCVRFCLKKKLFATFSQWLLSLVSLPLAKS